MCSVQLCGGTVLADINNGNKAVSSICKATNSRTLSMNWHENIEVQQVYLASKSSANSLEIKLKCFHLMSPSLFVQ